MDGASKFVKGDAIAGILILVVNIVGGLIIGLVQHDLPIGQAMKLYSIGYWRWVGRLAITIASTFYCYCNYRYTSVICSKHV